MLAFFSMLVFAMVGCGSEGMPGPDMMVNPDAGVDSDMAVIIEADAGTDSDVTLDDAGMDDDMGMEMGPVLVNECANAALNDCDVNATCTDTDEAFTCECNDGFDGNGTVCTDIDECLVGTDTCDVNATCENTVGSFECICDDGFGMNEAGECEQLFLVWIPERVVGASDVMKRDEAIRICDEHNGFFFESQMANRSDAPEFNADELHPFPPSRACGLITNTMSTSCEFYKNRAETFCHDQTTSYCNNYSCSVPSLTYGQRYNRCLNGDGVSMPHADMVTYATCVEECQEDLVWSDLYFFDSRAYSVFWNNPMAPYNTLVGGRFLATQYGDTAFNVICVVPESSIPNMPEGISGEYPRLPYTGAAQ